MDKERKLKVTPQEILEMLEDKQFTTKELANIVGVGVDTIKNRVRDLRIDGEAIIHNQNGFLKIDRENLKDEDIAQIMESFTLWLLSSMKGFYICAHPTKPLLPTMKKTLKLNLSVKERQLLATSCVKLKALLDHIEAEEDY